MPYRRERNWSLSRRLLGKVGSGMGPWYEFRDRESVGLPTMLKLGHCHWLIRTLGPELGQYPRPRKEHIANREQSVYTPAIRIRRGTAVPNRCWRLETRS